MCKSAVLRWNSAELRCNSAAVALDNPPGSCISIGHHTFGSSPFSTAMTNEPAVMVNKDVMVVLQPGGGQGKGEG